MCDTFPQGMLDDISDFLSAEASRATNLDVYDEVFERPLMFPLQRKNELAAMIRCVRPYNPHTVMEIGTDKGGGLYHWCKCLPTVNRVSACEIRGTPYSTLFEQAFPHIGFLWLPFSSYDPKSVGIVRSWLGDTTIDCLFIDGDKSAFLLDFDAYLPLMSDNSVVFMHDIQIEQPRTAFETLRARGYRVSILIDTTEARESLELAMRGGPLRSAHDQWLRYWGEASAGVGIIYLGSVRQSAKEVP